MDLHPFLKALEDSGLAVSIRNSLLFFPVLEALHVIALALVFGTIMVVDLRLLGVASTNRTFGRVSKEMLRWTWAAFGLAAFTGALMFITNARVYVDNGFFRAKFVLMALAGLNMLVFQLTAGRSIDHWEEDKPAPIGGRVAAVLSLVLWVLVIGMGRTIGFTTTGAAAKQAEPPPSVNFDDFLNAGPSGGPPAPPSGPEP